MKNRDFVSSVLWSLAPVVCVFRILVHGLLWLALSGIRKLFQLRYKTGSAPDRLDQAFALTDALEALQRPFDRLVASYFQADQNGLLPILLLIRQRTVILAQKH